MKKLIGMVAALAMSVTCLTACGGDGKDVFVGKWECKEMKAEGMTLTDEFMGIPVAAMFQVEFKDDNTGEVMVIGEETENIEWEADDDKVSFEVDGESVEFKKDGDTITASEGSGDTETTFVLVKVDKFTEFDASSLDDAIPDQE